MQSRESFHHGGWQGLLTIHAIFIIGWISDCMDGQVLDWHRVWYDPCMASCPMVNESFHHSLNDSHGDSTVANELLNLLAVPS